MNIKTFLTCAAVILNSATPRSILVQGPHGIGKSALARKLARKTIAKSTGQPLRLIDKRLAQLTEGDIIGLPFKNTEKRTTEWLPPDWIRLACEEPCLLFLDEGNRGTVEVLQASFQIVLDRCLGENKLHPETRIVMAVNDDSRIYQVTQMDPAYRDRFWQCDLTPTAEEWLAWARNDDPLEGGCIHPTICDFVAQNHTVLDPSDAADPSEKQPSRRSWEGFNDIARASGYINKIHNELTSDDMTCFTMIAQGFFGKSVADQFIEYFKTIERQVSADDVVNNWDDVKERVSHMATHEWNALTDRLVVWLQNNILTDDQAANIGKYVGTIDGELRIAFWMEAAKHHSKTVTNMKLFHKHIQPYMLEAATKATVGPRAEEPAGETAK